MKFRDAVHRFFAGRNGFDALNMSLFWLYLILLFLNLFLQSFILSVIISALCIYLLFRSLSRNLTARRAENAAYLRTHTAILQKLNRYAWFQHLQKGAKSFSIRLANLGTKRYRTCPQCKAKLCLPRRTGTHTVRCPKCGAEFIVRILF